MKPLIFLALCAAPLAGAAELPAPPHVHGAAALDVVLDASELQLHLDTPLDNLLGFEHAPRDAREAEQARAMVHRFTRPGDLFMPSAAAACVVQSTRIEAPVLDPKMLATEGVAGAPGAEAGKAPEPEGHADLDAYVTWRCAHPAELRALEAKIFAAFPRMVRIDAQVVTPGRQFAARLTPSNPAIAF